MVDANIRDVLARDLTSEQFAAAVDPATEILTLACAGSGKSRTLAYRIARLLAEGADAKSIVAFTFTEKAAESIKLRIAQALVAVGMDPTKLGAMYVGTIHSYCHTVLTAMDARYRQFEVLDENRLKLYLISRYPQLHLHDLRAARQSRYFETIAAVSEAWKTINEEMADLAAVTADDPTLARSLEALRDGLDRNEYIDFSLMIRLVVGALARDEASVRETVAPLKHLMVDEYQDVNPVQEALIGHLRRDLSSLFVVGDDDQAIYAWRGADVGNILNFRRRYPQSSQHTLSHNFRSTPEIVNAAEQFAAAELGATRLRKNPRASIRPGPAQFGRLWFNTREDEASWVASRIQELLGTAYHESDGSVRGLTPADFAILMRSTRSAESDGSPRHGPFTSALHRLGMAYTIEAGGGVFERVQVRVLRDTFELLRNESPDRQTAQAFFERDVIPAFPEADFSQFAMVLAEWGRLLHRPIEGARRRVYPQTLVHELLASFGLSRTDFDQGILLDLGVFSRMLQDVETVYMSVDSSRRFGEICNFLQHVAESGYDTGKDEIVRRPDTITVSTVHKAKGLEFPAVFVVDVEARRFPGDRRKYQGWLPQHLIQAALARGAYQSTPAEEARLFYTAITRAERFLYVTGSAFLPGGARQRQRSPFALRLSDPTIIMSQTALPTGLIAANPIRRIDETVVPTTYSDIRYYLRCPQDYRFRKIFGFSPPITEMFGFGQTVHAAVGKLHERYRVHAPSPEEARALAEQVFHLKHVPPSADPVNRPGGYERARASAGQIVRQYAASYADDFVRIRQLEVPFEIPVKNAVLSGSIDLLLKEDPLGNLLEASVVDFKAMEGGVDPETNERLEWTEMALQVQLYARAATEVLNERARTGAVHLLKDNQRIVVPVDDASLGAAVAIVEWAVARILAGDFPMRPSAVKCEACDFKLLCPKRAQNFATDTVPPTIHVPTGFRLPLAFSEFDA